MRRLKMVVYFLILGILSSLLGNVSFAWASTQDKLTITEIVSTLVHFQTRNGLFEWCKSHPKVTSKSIFSFFISTFYYAICFHYNVDALPHPLLQVRRQQQPTE